jgi:hypothetical protein
MTAEEIARHEAGHAAMAVTLGIPVRLVAADASGGRVEYLERNTRSGAIHSLMVILAGIVEYARDDDDLPEWPIEVNGGREGERYDREHLKHLAERLSLTESDWRTIVIATLTLSARPEYQRLITAACGLLDYTPVIDRELLAQVVAIAERKP